MATRKTGRHRRTPSGRWTSVSTLPGMAAPTDPGWSGTDSSRRRITREHKAPKRPPGRFRGAGSRGNRLHANRKRSPSSSHASVKPGLAHRLANGLWARVPRGLAADRGTWPKLAAVFLAVAALVGGGYGAYHFVTSSHYFAVLKVTISPTEHVSFEELRSLAALSSKDNVFSVDLEALARRVASHPWVLSAKARRRLPGEIHIDVVEQQPVAAVMIGSLYLVNESGDLFKRAGYKEARALPLITGVSREEYTRRRGAAEDRIRTAIDAISAYGARKGRPLLGEVHVDARNRVTLYSRRTGLQIRLGRGAFLTKLSRFDAVWAALGDRRRLLRVVRLDNRIRPERVTVRLAEDVDSVVQASAGRDAEKGRVGSVAKSSDVREPKRPERSKDRPAGLLVSRLHR